MTGAERKFRKEISLSNMIGWAFALVWWPRHYTGSAPLGRAMSHSSSLDSAVIGKGSQM